MITAQQHLVLSFTPIKHRTRTASGTDRIYSIARITKHGETQDAAIKRFSGAVKRRTRSAEPRRFPAFMPGHTTTAEYLRCYSALTGSILPIKMTERMVDLAPFHTGPEVTVEVETDEQVFA